MGNSLVNHYKTLQVDSEAEIEVIEAAYKRLALKYHPDINKSPEAEEKMKSINEARNVLINPQERRKYDQQFNQAPQEKQSQSRSRRQETVDEDNIWEENAVRNLATQILFVIQQLLHEKKWRLAKEKLYVFKGLGIQSKDDRISPTFEMLLPEWQKARELDALADQQADEFRKNLQKRSFTFYCTILGIVGLIWFGIAVGVDDFGMGILFGIIGAVIGIVVGLIVAPIGTWVYTKWYAGKWGEGTDNTLGILSPIILALVITFGIYIILAYIFLGALFQSFSSSNKRR